MIDQKDMSTAETKDDEKAQDSHTYIFKDADLDGERQFARRRERVLTLDGKILEELLQEQLISFHEETEITLQRCRLMFAHDAAPHLERAMRLAKTTVRIHEALTKFQRSGEQRVVVEHRSVTPSRAPREAKSPGRSYDRRRARRLA